MGRPLYIGDLYHKYNKQEMSLKKTKAENMYNYRTSQIL